LIAIATYERKVCQILSEESLRFDDTVDYKYGETPMTGYQFRACVELTREVKRLETKFERLTVSDVITNIGE